MSEPVELPLPSLEWDASAGKTMRQTVEEWIARERDRTPLGRQLMANHNSMNIAFDAGDWNAIGAMFNFLSVEVNMLQGVVTVLAAEVDRLAGRP